jgi:hypothetical protein
MRYWLLFAGKLAVAAAISLGLYHALRSLWPAQQPPVFGYDLGFTLVMGLWFLASWGLLYLAIWDQRYRCRVCLRRMRMPVQTGSWSRMLQLGQPQIEYICPYGHGKLHVAEVQFAGKQPPEWAAYRDMWEELTTAGPPEQDR